MKAVEEAEASGSTGDRGAWKWKIRQRPGAASPSLPWRAFLIDIVT